MVDFQELVAQAHERAMRVVAFLNLGYGHEAFPAFLKACDDVREGRESSETRMFVWSETGADKMERPLAPYFLNDAHGNWRWSERAQKYFWVKWEGEHGGYHLPQFNWGDSGWQEEAQRVLSFWRGTGIDGVVVDAVNWYIDCDWVIARRAMTDMLNSGESLFSQPEGAGGFGDDPVPWITAGGFTCVTDYALKIWWEGVDVVRDAVLTGDPRPIDEALRGYRDRVVAAGGVCYIDTADLDAASVAQRLLAAATVATVGELFLEIGDGADWDDAYRAGVRRLLEARRRYPALCAGGTRTALATSDDAHVYAFLREEAGEGTVVVVLNFASTSVNVGIDLGERCLGLRDIRTGEYLAAAGQCTVQLPGHGYAIYEAQPATEASSAFGVTPIGVDARV
jgi:glycosidase